MKELEKGTRRSRASAAIPVKGAGFLVGALEKALEEIGRGENVRIEAVRKELRPGGFKKPRKHRSKKKLDK